jgi:hypothetical protein
MPPILLLIAGGGLLAYLLSSKSSAPTGTPLPRVLPGQTPGTSFGPGGGGPPGMAISSFGPGVTQPHFNPAMFTAFTHHLGVQNFASQGVPMPSGHDIAPLPVPVGPGLPPPPTPVPVQVPGVQHVMVATHDTGPSGNLAIRSSPSKSGGVLAEAPHGSVLAVTGANVDDPAMAGGWSPVLQESSGIAGYSCTAYLKAI